MHDLQHRIGVQHVCDYFLGTCCFESARGFGRTNKREGLVTRLLQMPQQWPTDRASGAGNKNFHLRILSWV